MNTYSSNNAPIPSQSNISATVKWFNPGKGFGFVAPQSGGPDAFLHVSVLQRSGLSAVSQGATIVCDLEMGPKGAQVASIQSVDDQNDAPNAEDWEPDSEQSIVDGTVKFFSAEKGFGFAAPDAGNRDVFIGIVSLSRSGLQTLEAGQRVRLSCRKGKKGLMAAAVELLPS